MWSLRHPIEGNGLQRGDWVKLWQYRECKEQSRVCKLLYTLSTSLRLHFQPVAVLSHLHSVNKRVVLKIRSSTKKTCKPFLETNAKLWFLDKSSGSLTLGVFRCSLKGKRRSSKYSYCHSGGLNALEEPVQFACSSDTFCRNTYDILPPLSMKLCSHFQEPKHTLLLEVTTIILSESAMCHFLSYSLSQWKSRIIYVEGEEQSSSRGQ